MMTEVNGGKVLSDEEAAKVAGGITSSGAHAYAAISPAQARTMASPVEAAVSIPYTATAATSATIAPVAETTAAAVADAAVQAAAPAMAQVVVSTTMRK